MDLVNIFPPKNSLKNMIINTVIGSSSGLAVKEIKNLIKGQFGKSVTYQGVNKILISLKDEGVLEKEENLWRVNKDWIYSVTDAFSNYSKDEIPIYNSKMKSVSFNTINKALNFILMNMESGALKNGGEDILIMHSKNFGFYGLETKQKNLMKKIFRKNETIFLIEKNAFLNKFVGKYLNSLGGKTYLGIKRSTPYTTVVFGNTLIYAFFPQLADFMKSAYKNIKNVTSATALDFFNTIKDDPQYSIKFTFETDKEIVDVTKRYLLDQSKKGKKV